MIGSRAWLLLAAALVVVGDQADAQGFLDFTPEQRIEASKHPAECRRLQIKMSGQEKYSKSWFATMQAMALACDIDNANAQKVIDAQNARFNAWQAEHNRRLQQ